MKQLISAGRVVTSYHFTTINCSFTVTKTSLSALLEVLEVLLEVSVAYDMHVLLHSVGMLAQEKNLPINSGKIALRKKASALGTHIMINSSSGYILSMWISLLVHTTKSQCSACVQSNWHCTYSVYIACIIHCQ